MDKQALIRVQIESRIFEVFFGNVDTVVTEIPCNGALTALHYLLENPFDATSFHPSLQPCIDLRYGRWIALISPVVS